MHRMCYFLYEWDDALGYPRSLDTLKIYWVKYLSESEKERWLADAVFPPDVIQVTRDWVDRTEFDTTNWSEPPEAVAGVNG